MLQTGRHGHRQASYGPYDYFGEFGQVVAAVAADTDVRTDSNLLGPSVATGDWRPEGASCVHRSVRPINLRNIADVWNTGFVLAYANNLAALTVEQYVLYPPFTIPFGLARC